MTTANALVITLGRIDSHHYLGWKGEMSASAHDAEAMTKILSDRHINVTPYVDDKACSKAILDAIASNAATLVSGDLFIVYYSGHGAQLDDLNLDEAEDTYDEAWCLYDRMLVDDELCEALAIFKAGVRVVTISDSCHGGMAQFIPTSLSPAARYEAFKARKIRSEQRTARSKEPPYGIIAAVYAAHLDQYKTILKMKRKTLADAKAAVLVMGACKDTEPALIGDVNSVYTGAIQTICDGVNFTGSYNTLHQRASQALEVAYDQHPQIRPEGTGGKELGNQPAFKPTRGIAK